MHDGKTGPLKPLKWYKDLADRQGRMAGEAFLLEGPRAVRQVLSSDPGAILEILSTKEQPGEYSSYPQRLLTASQLKSVSSTQTPQDIIAVVRLPLETYSDALPPVTGGSILLLEDVQDPGNVGTLIRTAAAFGYSGTILTDKCADPFSPKCLQASAGTVLSLWIRRTPHYIELIRELKNKGFSLAAMDLRGREDMDVLQSSGRLLLALGNEAAGLSQPLLELADHRLKIPVAADKAESLNVASCGAICMYLGRPRA